MEDYNFSEASCLDEDPDLFFSDDNYVYDKKKVARAKLICRGCPLKDPCLEMAMKGGYQGVWGGLTEADRTRRINGTERSTYTPEERARRAEAIRSSNEKKMLEASAKHIAALKKALERHNGKDIPAEVMEVIRIRIDNPELSLDEVGQRATIPVTRFAVASRFRRFIQTADEHEKEKQQRREKYAAGK